ncbi:MAG: N-methyl-L-tryptophan oxidase [Deltaproteobacteria bacterium]|nr:N-methyl-L-tryptophan oxidase [Deltaproteobacteria bacterium]MBK8713316.1 N-methyl-L-tryptophan oxidase [Deltaproteobacteria bacterium]MBP7289339.1 N-methyl-L-tryptophan oxidase [Nannocystaceae bacterium]
MGPTKTAIVVGGGTMGLASAWALARAGVQVTVLERFGHVHERGSHGGFTRIIRQAYHEGENYVPLVQRADALWCELAARSGRALLDRTGMLEFGPPGDHELLASIDACERHGVDHQRFDADLLMRRWPFVVPAHWHGCFTPSGGQLHVQACLDALRDEAMTAGAALHYDAVVREISRGDRCGVVLDDGRRVHADRVVVTAGAWLPQLLPQLLPERLTPLRRVLTWWRPAPEHRDALTRLPVWGAFDPRGFFYGFPYADAGIAGVKIACHVARGDDHRAAEPGVDPDHVDRALHEHDLAPLRQFIDEHFPCAGGELVDHRVCLYTATPSWDFVIDRDPEDARVIVAGGCSGHGFKFAPAVGELVARLVQDDGSAPPQQFCRARHMG